MKTYIIMKVYIVMKRVVSRGLGGRWHDEIDAVFASRAEAKKYIDGIKGRNMRWISPRRVRYAGGGE